MPQSSNYRNMVFIVIHPVTFVSRGLKGLSQPPPFSMTSKLLIKHGEANSYCFTVPKVCLIILSSFTVIFLRLDRLRITHNRQILACKQKQKCG